MGIRPECMVSQQAKSSVTQTQNVIQSNNNEQVSAVAYAEDGGTATAQQLSNQSNANSQIGTATAENRIDPSCCDGKVDQVAEAEVEQNQSVEQANINQQNESTATAIGEGSEATSTQQNDQENINSQIGNAEAENICGEDLVIENARKKDVVKQDSGFEQKEIKQGHVVTNEAVIGFNGIKITVSIVEDKHKMHIQAEKNGVIAVSEFRPISSKVKYLKTESTLTAHKIVVVAEEAKDSLEIQLTNSGEIVVKGEEIATV